MSKRITGVFETRDGGQQAAQSLLQQQINPEQLSLLAGAPIAPDPHEEEVRPGEAASTIVGSVVTGLTTLAIPGIGILIGAAAAIATMSATAASSDAATEREPIELEQMLLRLGFTQEQVHTYAEDVRLGRTLLAVDAEEAQTDLIADTMHRYGGYKLEFRPTQG
jgi:hypothetical protein